MTNYFNYKDKSKDELIIEFQKLQQEFDSLKTSYEKDIAELRQAEKTLVHEQFLMKVIMDNLPDHIYFKDLESRFIRINKSLAQFIGLNDPDQAVGKKDSDFFTGEHAQQAYNDEQTIIRTGQLLNIEEKETHHNRPDTWVSTIKLPLRDKEGNTIGTFGISRDITDRKKADQALIENEGKYKLLITNIRDVVYSVDIATKEFAYLSPSFERITGYTLEDIKEMGGRMPFLTKVVTEAKFTEWDDYLLQLNKGHIDTDFKNDTWWLCKDGSYKCLQDHWIPIYVNGKLVSTDGVLMDITERKQAEEALRLSEEKFRSLAQSANDAIITTDTKGKISGWNKGAEKIFGYPESEIIGEILTLIVPRLYIESHINGMKRVESDGEKHVIGRTVELVGLHKHGNIFPIELSLSEWETSDGKFFTGIIRDISKRKRIEMENQIIYEITQGVTTNSNLDGLLKLIHQSLRKIVYAENCFVALYNQNTGLFSFPYFVDKFDTTPEPASMGKSCSAYVLRTRKPLLLTQKIFDQLLEQNEVELIGSNSPSWIGIPLQTPSSTIGVLVLQHYEKENVYSESDVKFLVSIGSQIAISIELKKAEEEIKLKNELLQAINAEKDKFFSILAHDLRGPLSAFVAATQILTDEIQNMTLEEVKEITLSMKESSTNIYSLLENLLEWSRLKRGIMNFNPEKIKLKLITTACIELLKESARKKEIKISCSLPDDLEIYADSHMLETVIRNLVSNAIKFTPKSGEISISAAAMSNNTIEIKIRDSGIGMSQELISKLFLLNEKTNRKGTEGEPSTGLGLLLCKEFIEKNGGQIWVESEEGKGSTFSFVIPDQEGITA
jgi:PAS domain S-box-containing protein